METSKDIAGSCCIEQSTAYSKKRSAFWVEKVVAHSAVAYDVVGMDLEHLGHLPYDSDQHRGGGRWCVPQQQREERVVLGNKLEGAKAKGKEGLRGDRLEGMKG
ncbi:MAG: hypothetical protein FRX49_07282 [Trebouxia sp. A1-2]|nr:MAG: hypothetical protein FRX49_07282 [Trebouxia sp. A1-2]